LKRFDKHLLSDILGVVEVAEFGVGKRIDAPLVFVHQKAKRFFLTVEAFIDDVSIFCSHDFAPIIGLYILDTANDQKVTRKNFFLRKF